MRSPKSLQTLLLLCTVFFNCSGEHKPENLCLSEAAFDYFSYQGNDSVYTEQPLTSTSQFYNPILPGWNSDPSVCANDTDYFLVTSSFIYFPGVPLFHSTDLVNWKQIGYILNRMSQMQNMQKQLTNGGIYAPDISYNQHNRTYYMITTNVGTGNFFVKTKNPFGKWSDPIYLPEIKGIDPAFFFDDDGQAYIVHNDASDKTLYEGHRVIKIRPFDTQTDRTVGKDKIIVNGGVNLQQHPIWIEGPHLYKINGRYLLLAAEGGTGFNHSEVVFASNDAMGTYLPWERNPILTQRHLPDNRSNAITCTGHADMIQDIQGNWWAFFLGCRPIAGKFENLGRETFMMPVRWSTDSFPYITQGDEQIPVLIEKKGTQRQQGILCGNWTAFDNFDTASLAMSWMTLRTPPDSCLLTKHPGFLTLTATKTPSFIARRLQHHVFKCETKLFFVPVDSSEYAGLLLYKDETHQYALVVNGIGHDKTIQLRKIGILPETLATARLSVCEQCPVYLKIESSGLTFDFSYAIKNGKWKTLARDVNAEYLFTQNAGGFTGTTIGLYALKQ